MRKASSITKVLSDLTSKHGAQPLSPALRRIEIESIPSSGAHASHRLFVKKVLPRIKYNNQSLEIDVRWKMVNSEKSKNSSSNQSSELNNEGQTIEQSIGTINSTQSNMPVRARLLFDGLPTREVNLRKDADVNEITNEIFQVVREMTQVPEPVSNSP